MRNDTARGYNVVGVVKGTDPALAKEAILVGAHGDHVGPNFIGITLPGADDNGSGCSSVMEMARGYASHPQPRTLIFCIFGGEEQGLLGSKALAKSLPDDYTYINMVNLDMVGRGEGKFGLGGADQFPEIWGDWWKSLPDSIHKQYSANRAWGGESSDHAPFRNSGIPAFTCYSKGHHDFYHQPADRFATIDTAAVAGAVNGAARWIHAIANYPEPLAEKHLEARTIWHYGLPITGIEGVSSPGAIADSLKHLLENGWMASVIKLPLPDSPRGYFQLLSKLDAWNDFLGASENLILTKKLKDLPGNGYARKQSVYLAMSLDHLSKQDTTRLTVLGKMGLSWLILEKPENWVLENEVRQEKSPLVSQINSMESIVQVPLDSAVDFLPVIKECKQPVVIAGDWNRFNQVKLEDLDRLNDAGGHFLLTVDKAELPEFVLSSAKADRYKAHIQPPLGSYEECLQWVESLEKLHIERDQVNQWLAGNLKLWQ